MKTFKKSLILSLAAVLLLVGCTRDVNLKWKSYVYDNGELGRYEIYERIDFLPNGSVYYVSRVGTSSEFNTKGCSLYYILSGEDLVIYHGIIGWKKEVRNTPFMSCKYYGNVIVCEDKEYRLE